MAPAGTTRLTSARTGTAGPTRTVTAPRSHGAWPPAGDSRMAMVTAGMVRQLTTARTAGAVLPRRTSTVNGATLRTQEHAPPGPIRTPATSVTAALTLATTQ